MLVTGGKPIFRQVPTVSLMFFWYGFCNIYWSFGDVRKLGVVIEAALSKNPGAPNKSIFE